LFFVARYFKAIVIYFTTLSVLNVLFWKTAGVCFLFCFQWKELTSTVYMYSKKLVHFRLKFSTHKHLYFPHNVDNFGTICGWFYFYPIWRLKLSLVVN